MHAVPEPCLEGLRRAGMLVRNDNEFRPANAEAARSLALFAPLLRAFDVQLVPYARPDCPVHFCTAIVRPRPAGEQAAGAPARALPAGGQGGTPVAAATSCIGEVAERLSLCSLGISDKRVAGSCPDVPELDLGACLGFSADQEAGLMARQAFRAVDQDGRIGWGRLTPRRIAVRNLLTGARAQLPAFGALFDEPVLEDGRGAGVASSAGCAVWPDLPGARQRALLELVERDAVAQGWYNRMWINPLQEAEIDGVLSKKMSDYLSLRARRTVCLRVGTNLPVHVVMAVSHDGTGRMAAFGSSAGFDLPSAADGAVREMLQAENALEWMARAYPDKGAGAEAAGPVPPSLHYARSRSILDDLPMGRMAPFVPGGDQRVFTYGGLLEALETAGITVWEFDATRADLNVPCVKLFSPELCSWQPRFGKARLYRGVVECGLRETPATEEEFAARPVPF